MGRRLPNTLVSVGIPHQHAAWAERRIQPQVDYAAAWLSGHRPLRDQMKELALSCYLQGVSDGVQTAKMRPEVMALLCDDDVMSDDRSNPQPKAPAA